MGEILVAVATAVRRYKSENSLPLGSEIKRLQLEIEDTEWAGSLVGVAIDLCSISRAREVEMVSELDAGLLRLQQDEAGFTLAIEAYKNGENDD